MADFRMAIADWGPPASGGLLWDAFVSARTANNHRWTQMDTDWVPRHLKAVVVRLTVQWAMPVPSPSVCISIHLWLN